MVRQNLQGNEQCCNNASCQIFTPVSQYDTCYCRWYISQRDKLPDMSGRSQNEEVGMRMPTLIHLILPTM